MPLLICISHGGGFPTFAVALPLQDLWGQVLRCAAHRGAAQHLLTEAEVHDLDVALGVHEDVLQLEVAIHHAHAVQVLQARGHLRQVEHANVPPESMFTLDLENVEEIVALHVLHEEEEVAPGLEVALVPDQEGVAGGGQDPPLVDAVLHVPHILHELLLQGFHGHHVPAPRVPHQQHLAEGAAADGAEDGEGWRPPSAGGAGRLLVELVPASELESAHLLFRQLAIVDHGPWHDNYRLRTRL